MYNRIYLQGFQGKVGSKGDVVSTPSDKYIHIFMEWNRNHTSQSKSQKITT